MTRCFAFLKRPACQGLLTLLLALGPAQALAQTRVACVGEASTHSAHRNYDPEYPELMGLRLDSDFQTQEIENPMSGGMLYGGGTLFSIGNFGVPKGSAMDHEPTDQAESTLRSSQLILAEDFAPHLVILGPYGPHEPYTGVELSQFRPDLQALAERVLAFGSTPGLLIALPLPRNGTDGDTTRRQIYDDTVQVAAELNLVSIDLWGEFLGKSAEFEDQNHLNLAGREHMAQVIGDAVLSWQLSNEEPTTNSDAGSPVAAGGASAAGTAGAGLGGSAGGSAVSGSAGLGEAGGSAGGSGSDIPASTAGGGVTASSGNAGSGSVPEPMAPVGMAGGSSSGVTNSGGAASNPVPGEIASGGGALPGPAAVPAMSAVSMPPGAPTSSAAAPSTVMTDTSGSTGGCSLVLGLRAREPHAAVGMGVVRNGSALSLGVLGLFIALRRRRSRC